ncbi:MAG: cytochrome P450 [Hyphomicrobiales bacterium]|nr:cytochrome P450 [Hyphomicrobiales bacterium]
MTSILSTVSNGTPAVLDMDPFSIPCLEDPFSLQHAVRETDTVVWLKPYGIYAVGRHAEAKDVLSDHTRFTTTAGVGLADIRDPNAWRVKNPLLEVDPPEHSQIRSALMKIMSPIVIRRWKSMFEEEAELLVSRLLEKGTFDGLTDLAETFVTTVFPRTVGITIDREKVIQFGDLNFNANGPQNELYWRAFEKVEPLLPWFDDAFKREGMTPGGIGAQIYDAEEAGIFPKGTAVGLVRVLFRGGFDTTISGIAFALQQLAAHPRWWNWLREDWRRAGAVFDEALRHQSPAQVMFRTTVPEGATIGSHSLEGDKKIAVFIGAANRDPRRWDKPEIFDPTRDVSGAHLAFGVGAHACLGLLIAKFEAEAVLGAFARRVNTLEPDGKPKYRLVNTLRTLSSLPLRVTAP